ncbi:hypothetical protein BV898_01293 [Hypsibius exemplaris]|uniref:G-protein coupled receptors family 1 profile domain-containing protein n=1 Tax=Hypsibius exemplaris TaxID=2072580 RepID=A0A1W0XBP9_HYPEX|nr:hypothetical protein BV898_01293 [Hypsibius exemplaris]
MSNVSVAFNSSRNFSNPNNTIRPSAVSADGWFVFSILCSSFGSALLILLLVTSFHRKHLHTGSNILVIHLMCIDLLMRGIFSPFPSSLLTSP